MHVVMNVRPVGIFDVFAERQSVLPRLDWEVWLVAGVLTSNLQLQVSNHPAQLTAIIYSSLSCLLINVPV